jgi:phosphotransferase system, enzyme I, PtsP
MPQGTFSESSYMNDIQLICDIGELNEAFTDSESIETFLERIVEMVARHMNADVCSVYLYDDEAAELVLRATHGLSKSAVNKIRLKIGEGLAGLALKEKRPVSEKIGKDNPNFKYFPGSSEELYDAFLAVPILRAISKIGVLVVQRKKAKIFNDNDIVTLRAVASQLANMLEMARLFITQKTSPMSSEKKPVRQLKLQKGKVASEGFAFAPSRVFDKERTAEVLFNREYPGNYSLRDFKKAVAKTAKQLEQLQASVEKKLSDVASLIFTAHLLLLKDKEFTGSMIRKIEEGVEPPHAVISVARHYTNLFSLGSNAYIREKVQDIHDVCIRILGNLVDEYKDTCFCKDHIVIAQDLFPSDILKLSSENVQGVVLVSGGVTSHLSILARSLKIPMLIVDSSRLLSIPDETPVMLDAEVGNFYINPAKSIVDTFNERNENRKNVKAKSIHVKHETFTKDGKKIRLLASINLLSDLKLANEVNSEGVGLYRTEFPFLIRADFPSEEEQYVVYKQLVDSMPGKEITFRTLDIGGDKVLSYYEGGKEQNPFLGMRSVRFSLSNKELFHQQIRAILRAGADAKIRIMFPMISSYEEFIEARDSVNECIDMMKQKKMQFNKNPEIGLMIEVPSVIPVMDDLAAEADFFSIGTNDLVQYMIAVDRTNEKVASYYVPHHPAVLRAIKTAVKAVLAKGKNISICGDMAHNELYLPFFAGIGVTEMTVEASFIPKVQTILGLIDSHEAAELSDDILRMKKVSDILRALKQSQPERDQKRS